MVMPFLTGFLGYLFFFEQKQGSGQLVLASVAYCLLAIFDFLELLGFVSG